MNNIKKYGLFKVLKAHLIMLFDISTWSLLWWKVTPRRIIKYILATHVLELHESGKK